MKIIVLCDRYNKGERIVASLDLNLIRNLLNKYNQKHLEAFLLEQPNALLFAHFFLIAGYAACKEQSDVESSLLFYQMSNIMRESLKNLPEMV